MQSALRPEPKTAAPVPVHVSIGFPLHLLVGWDVHRAMHIHESSCVFDMPFRTILKFQEAVVFNPKLGIPFKHQPSATKGQIAPWLNDEF
jgi:hypothetical protein